MVNRTYNKPFQLYLDTKDSKQVKAAAGKRGISVSGLLRMILREWLEANEINDKKE